MSPDGQWIAIRTYAGRVNLYSLDTMQVSLILEFRRYLYIDWLRCSTQILFSLEWWIVIFVFYWLADSLRAF